MVLSLTKFPPQRFARSKVRSEPFLNSMHVIGRPFKETPDRWNPSYLSMHLFYLEIIVFWGVRLALLEITLNTIDFRKFIANCRLLVLPRSYMDVRQFAHLPSPRDATASALSMHAAPKCQRRVSSATNGLLISSICARSLLLWAALALVGCLYLQQLHNARLVAHFIYIGRVS